MKKTYTTPCIKEEVELLPEEMIAFSEGEQTEAPVNDPDDEVSAENALSRKSIW